MFMEQYLNKLNYIWQVQPNITVNYQFCPAIISGLSDQPVDCQNLIVVAVSTRLWSDQAGAAIP